MDDLFPEYVYRNLRKFKNCSVSYKTYKKYGENKILEDLANHGFNCKIKITIQEDFNMYAIIKHSKEVYVIAEVI